MSFVFTPAPPERVAEAVTAARDVFAGVGAELVDPPVLQPANLYLDLAGEDVRSRLFLVEAPDGELFCMRPDLTIPVCRHHLATGRRGGAYWYEGKAFRYRPPESRRPNEFIQIGLETFAPVDSAAAEIEAVRLALAAINAVGGTVERFLIGDAGLFDAFASALDVPDAAGRRVKLELNGALPADAPLPQPSPLADAIAQAGPDKAAAALEEIYSIAGVTPVGARPAAAIAKRLIAKAQGAREAALDPSHAGSVGAAWEY